MADTTRVQVLTYLENANMMEISDLISDIEEKFGVTAAAPLQQSLLHPQVAEKLR